MNDAEKNKNEKRVQGRISQTGKRAKLRDSETKRQRLMKCGIDR